MARLITARADQVSGADFFAALTGRPRQSEAEKAEADARRARVALFETIERVEYARARRERELAIREWVDGETYEERFARLNDPFVRAAERVNAAVADHQQRKAA